MMHSSRIYKIKRFLLTVSFVAFLSLVSWSTALQEVRADSTLPLVIDAQNQSTIVTADTPSSAAALGARVLAEHIQQISGAKVPIVKEGALKNLRIENQKILRGMDSIGSTSTFILVGESALAEKMGVNTEGLGLGGIRLKTVGNALILLGNDGAGRRNISLFDPEDPSLQKIHDRNATLYAVTTFLEEQLGVRYLWPGESGKVIPQNRTLHIKAVDFSYTPKILQRHIRNSIYGERTQVGLDQLGVEKEEFLQLQKTASETKSLSPDWFTWQYLGGSMGLVTGHSFGYIWEKYGKEHPDWFALQPNGSRDQSAAPTRARLCVSNPELQIAVARDRIETLDKNPQQTSVSIDPNDGGGVTFCVCEECKKLDPPEGRPIKLWDHERNAIPYVSLTDRMVFFWNRVAEKVTEKHPNALLTVRAYSTYSAPPLKNKLHPNIVVEQVSQDYFDLAQVERYRTEWQDWGKFTQQLAWRPNIDAGNRRHGFPTIYVHRMAEDFKARAAAGTISTDIDSMSKSWATNGLNLYVLARLHWDPTLDLDGIIDDYCESGFGKGGPIIKKYFARIEEITEQAADVGAANPAENARGRLMTQTLAYLYNASTIEVLNALLDQAQQAAGNDAASIKRVEFLRRGLQLADVQAEAFRLIHAAASGEKEIDKKEVLPFMERRYNVMRDIFYNEPLAINISYLLWGSEGNFRVLQSKDSWDLLRKNSGKSFQVVSKTRTVVGADEHGLPEELEEKTTP